MYLSADEPTRSLRTAGEHLIVGGEGHPVGDRHDTRQHYANLEAWASEHFDGVRVVHRWSAQDWAAGDGVPYIGRMAGHGDGVFVATAFKKWGMTHGTVAGRLIADLLGGRENPWTEVFDGSRIAPGKNLKGIVDENLHTLRHFVGDRFATRSADTLDHLERGEGTIVRIGGTPVAVHRDDEGVLHGVSARCTHLGCHVSFNRAEQSWDCPCHGSRFAADGTLLEGPATDDLEPRDLKA
jgi:Rieske Fe-S protein